MKHLIIDCNNLLYRGYYVSNLTDKDGNRISGVFNSIKMFQNLLRKFKPDSVFIVWDAGKSKERLKVYNEYKKQRDKNRNEIEQQSIHNNRLILQKIFNYLPVKQLEVNDVEADDIIGWLVNEKLKGEKLIVSNDTDFIQLVNSKTLLFLPNKAKILSDKNIDEFLGFPSKHYVLWKSLVGDPSDNIKGPHGIGPKKATAIILNGLNGKKKLPISDSELAILNRNKYLIAIGAVLSDDDLKRIRLNYKLAKSNLMNISYKEVKEIFKKLDFKSMLNYFGEFEFRLSKLTRKVKSDKRKNKEKDKKKKGI